jgi:hypothetical protein
MSAEPKPDWRIDNAEHLKGVRLQYLRYTQPSPTWDHDHCAGCWAKFAEFEGEDILHEGYTTCEDDPRGACCDWVCPSCFGDLKDEMQWTVASD